MCHENNFKCKNNLEWEAHILDLFIWKIGQPTQKI